MSNPTCFHMSATAISAFKACPTRYRLGYREGLRVAEDTDSQRMGTNWHALHEVYQNSYGRNTLDNGAEGCDEDAHTHAHEAALDAALAHLNERYTTVPVSKTADEWEIERQVLVTSFLGYLWYWQDDPISPIVSEVPFKLPLHMPKTGLPLLTSEVVRVGKIDHIVEWQGMVGNVERKSTSRSISPDSDYWDRSRKDTQVSMYALAFRDMAASKLLPDEVLTHPCFNPDRFGNTLYDVWHKPTIKPAKLTQAKTVEFLGEVNQPKPHEQEYCGQCFQVEYGYDGDGAEPYVAVDGVQAEIEQGKRGFAIRETPAMFGARLLEDIQSRPEFYYQRKEIARTDRDISKFRVELYNIYQAMKQYARTECWFENEEQCRATYACSYIDICYGSGADAVCDGRTTPPKYKRIFTDLTTEGQSDDRNKTSE